jgi:hypothetical protein
MARADAAIGFAPHSGWTALVALGGDPKRPRVLLRERLELTSSRLPGPKQPYHAVEELAVAKAAPLLERYLASATKLAGDGLRGVVATLEGMGFRVHGAATLDSNGRQGTSLEAILASHALIHTADGEHFRRALDEASRACGFVAIRVRQRELPERAAAVLRRPAAELQAHVAAFGKTVGPPWGADQKQAALLAWLSLASR